MINEIVVLSEIEAVRKNPSMYIGSSKNEGVYHLLTELLHNSIDEAVLGLASEISVTIDGDSCEVTDNGRGLPIAIHSSYGISQAEIAFSRLHAGSKFNKTSNQFTAGLHGIGLSCVNALSDYFFARIFSEKQEYAIEYRQGRSLMPLKSVGATSRRGTSILFRPDKEIFNQFVSFEPSKIRNVLLRLSCLHPNIKFTIADKATGSVETYQSENGLSDLLAENARSTKLILAKPIEFHLVRENFQFDAVLNWSSSNGHMIDSFVNSVHTTLGGTHVKSFSLGVKDSLLKSIKNYLSEDWTQNPLDLEEALDGIYAVVSVKVLNPQFEGQTKLRLTNSEFSEDLRNYVEKVLSDYLAINSSILNALHERLIELRRVRTNSKRVAERIYLQFGEKKVDEAVYKEQFGARSKNWHNSAVWITDQELLKHHADLFQLDDQAIALDVCCGSGVVGASFKHKVKKVVGLDMTPEMVQLAKTRLDEVHQGNVYNLPFGDKSFDLVCTREVLHLLPYPEKAVAEIFRVLKPGGQFIVGQILPFSEVDAAWMFRIFKKKQPLVFNMFQEQDFRKMLLAGGFIDLEMRELNVWESIDVWIDSYETSHLHRHEIRRLYNEASEEVRAVHQFKVSGTGEIQDLWRWCIFSVRKPHLGQ